MPASGSARPSARQSHACPARTRTTCSPLQSPRVARLPASYGDVRVSWCTPMGVVAGQCRQAITWLTMTRTDDDAGLELRDARMILVDAFQRFQFRTGE